MEIYGANTDEAVLELDAGIKLTLREIRERLGTVIPWGITEKPAEQITESGRSAFPSF